MSARSIPSLLSLPDLITARNAGAEVQGTGVEAEADRHFINKRYGEAAEVYRSLDLDDRNRKEKLAYCLFCVEQEDFHTFLDVVIKDATPWGLALHLWAYDANRYKSGVTKEERAEQLTSVLQCALEMDSWPVLREHLIAGCWYHSLELAHGTPEMRALQSKASTALAECRSKCQETLELCTRIFNFYRDRTEPQISALSELVSTVNAAETPVLSVLYRAALVAGNLQQAKAALTELCLRFKGHHDLEPTVTSVAIEADRLEFLDCLPAELKVISLSRPEVQLLEAIAAYDQEKVVSLAMGMAADGPADSVLKLPCIGEPLLNFLLPGRTTHTGGWGDSAPWAAVMGERIYKVLPSGDLRNSFLRGFRDFLGDEEVLASARELCDLFEDSLAYDDFYWILRPECLNQINPGSFAKYLVKEAAEESEYSPFEADEIPWERFVPAIKGELAKLQPDERNTCETVLDAWGVPLQLSLARRLAGEGLPEEVGAPLEQIGAAISRLNGSDLAYLQLALMKLSARAAERISLAVGHEVSIRAYNDFVSPARLTEYGEGRVRTLAKRYGAAGVLQGLDALITNPEFNPETDRELPALSIMLVKLQGGLSGRRAYLAGILRKRLKNLKSYWLDQQVSEAMVRGVDIEQMIDLAKNVNSWDDWSDGLAGLRPY